ncbi:unnamed protein product [Macrosiphum euphorbiae]|uniref:TTF-type domain-containing protein n=1 Tax=Macrosiphum euphorbiae TaxID=13131 RepID=A0AAV0XV30_9HEMI|nr:unnamed protein product [Macrosiphum euphorbiae]CAI6371277.1 unnamed protein product [Macrosiphum euphorbiae]
MERFLITPGNLKSTAVSTVSEPNDPESIARTPISDTNKQLNLNIFDISVTCEDTAVQPVISFPRTFISLKQLSFQSSWYNKYPWLEYSIKMNAVFCYYCRHFPSHSQIEKDVLITGGYCDWKNISNMTKKHDKTTSHKNAIAKYGAWLSTKKTGSVSTQINKQVKEQVIKNRAILKSVIRCVLYCARQDIGLREHRRERKEEFNSENYDASLCSRHDVNEGNFLEIIKLLSIENEHFKTNFNLLPKNSKYISPEIQNDIIKATSKLVLGTINSKGSSYWEPDI